MKLITFITIVLVIILSFIIVNNNTNFKDTEWLVNSPKLLTNAPANTSFSFAVTEPAAIYWRVYHTVDFIPQAHDLTNTNNLSETIAYGGNTSVGNGATYTNIITNLNPATEYILYAIAVSYIGNFPKDIKQQTFKTTP